MILPLSVDLEISSTWELGVEVGGGASSQRKALLRACVLRDHQMTTNRDPPHGAALKLRLSYAPRVLACVFCGFCIIHVHLEHNLNPAALTFLHFFNN